MKHFSFCFAICCFLLAGCTEDNNYYYTSEGDDVSKPNDDMNHNGDNNKEQNPSDPSNSSVPGSDETCYAPKTICKGVCTDLSGLHLASCTRCEDGYCDADSQISNGCEIRLSDNNPAHCGTCGNACGAGQQCINGECKGECGLGETSCGSKCLKLDDLHLASCNACAENYSDSDGDFSNGCDVNNFVDPDDCGGHGACQKGDSCVDGVCVHRYYVMYESDRYETTQKLVTSSGASAGTIPTYSIVYVMEQTRTMSRISSSLLSSSDTWINTEKLLDAGDQYEGRKAVDYAETFLYNRKDKLCTYDFHLNGRLSLDRNGTYDRHCIDFLEAILTDPSIGLLSVKTDYIPSLRANCTAGNDGYHLETDPHKAKPGDIWIKPGDGHAEIVIGFYEKDQKYLMIGSNNDSSKSLVIESEYGCNGGKESNYNACSTKDCSDNQRVTYHSRTDSLDGTLCSRN